MGFIKDTFDALTGKTAAKASRSAAATSAGAQREALDYLKQVNELPQQFKEQALSQLAGLSGMAGGTGSQQELIDRARQSPLFSAIMGGQQAGEESILRSASATGGLRSGNVQSNLADYTTQLQNQALLQSYNQQLGGLQGLAGLQTAEQQIGQGISGIGTTLAQGQIGAAQAQQQGIQGTLGLGLKAAGLFI